MYFVRTPFLLKLFYNRVIWEVPRKEKSIYLTFDDGPDEIATPALLQLLDKFNAKATFFCTGKKAKKYPDIVKNILTQGHSIGNHGFEHKKSHFISNADMMADVEKCSEFVNSDLYRPPYGRINPLQIREIRKKYKIVLWTLMPGDFDTRVSKELLLKRSIRYTQNGTILVFHDTQKTIEKLMFVLPEFLSYFAAQGYNFQKLSIRDIDKK
ncbi:MAG: polysaccharide deacetylase family protein [Bacteroidales bacterium]|nr:polysaccharide deacetylase family protein [Bacteroidales bacterium]